MMATLMENTGAQFPTCRNLQAKACLSVVYVRNWEISLLASCVSMPCLFHTDVGQAMTLTETSEAQQLQAVNEHLEVRSASRSSRSTSEELT